MKLLPYLIIALFFTACGTVKYVPVESVRTETEYRDRVQTRTDSVYIRDSVIVRLNGDTVTIERWRDRYRDRVITDTLVQWHERIDSVAVPYLVEKDLTTWQRIRLSAFWWLIVALGALGSYTFRRPLLSLIKKLL